jgi:isoleucyl-tRNA synthetase
VLTHGFVVDETGRKMSKSLGNVIAPQDVMKRSGGEILRLWVSMVDYREEMRLGNEILARVIEAYRKIRNTCRYLLANLYDFDPVADRLRPDQLQEVDRYALSRYASAGSTMLRAYEEYDFPAIFHTLNQFTTVDLSAFYADISKDRLYTFGPASTERRSSQTAMYVMIDGLARLMAPVLPVTADEIWRYLPGTTEESVHLALFPTSDALSALLDPALVATWDRLIAVRDQVNRALEAARQEKVIGNALGARVTIEASGDEADLLERYREGLPMLFITSQVELTRRGGPAAELAIRVNKAVGEKCARCWRYVRELSDRPETEGLCARCVDALEGAFGAAGASKH